MLYYIDLRTLLALAPYIAIAMYIYIASYTYSLNCHAYFSECTMTNITIPWCNLTYRTLL